MSRSPGRGPQIFSLGRSFSTLANHRRLALAFVGLVALLSSSVPYFFYSRSITPFSAWSFFNAYDEYSYLLAADTYASGRLTNPPHPMWRHFATPTVIQEPTYQSIYPPGQGLFLALGKLLTGHPIVGVWISVALACTATCYLLQAWFPPRWALFGGLIAALHARIALEWGGTYWGGGVAMLGGALTFGGLRHLLGRPRTSDAVLFAMGLALLANSRPFEGLVASSPAMTVLAAWLVREWKRPHGRLLGRVLVPIVVVLSLTAVGMAHYNFRVTGSAWTMPYQIYLKGSGAERTFIWQQAMTGTSAESRSAMAAPADGLGVRQVGYSYDEGQDSSDGSWWFARVYLALLAHPAPIVAVTFKIAVQWAFYLGPLLTVPLLALPWAMRTRWAWFALSTVGMTMVAVLATTGAYPHYLAPVAPLIFVLVVAGMRSVNAWKHNGRRIGPRWLSAIALLWVIQLVLVVALFPRLLAGLRWGESRARLQAQLESMEGRHLVIVRYGPRHVFYKEWVYNEADIDNAKVIWARELSPDLNERLLAYFDDRRVWLVQPDSEPTALLDPVSVRNPR